MKSTPMFCVTGLLFSLAASAGPAATRPLAVSPGADDEIVAVENRCPTFSWGAVTGASTYELLVYRADDARDEEPVLRHQVRGAATSWTPPLASCFVRGAQYAWTVRAYADGSASAWSAARLFAIAAGPSDAELEAALAVVRDYELTRGGRATETGAAGTAAARPPRQRAGVAAAGAATTQLEVDGGVVATSFAGDGAALTALDPANLASGSAAIDITGNAATASDADTLDGLSSGDLATASSLASHAADPNAHGTPPTSLPPDGPAGGSLAGTYPSPSLAANSVGDAELTDDPTVATLTATGAVSLGGRVTFGEGVQFTGRVITQTPAMTGTSFVAQTLAGFNVCTSSGYRPCTAWEAMVLETLSGDALFSQQGWVIGSYPNTDEHMRSLVNGQNSVVCPAGSYLFKMQSTFFAGSFKTPGGLHCVIESVTMPVHCCRDKD